MTILVDMNLSPLWIPFLVDHGFEAVHWSTIGSASAPDVEILDRARVERWTVFTHDLDFGRLLAMQRDHGPSVVQIRTQDVMPTSVGHRVIAALKAARPYLDSGALVTIDPTQDRIRLLPI